MKRQKAVENWLRKKQTSGRTEALLLGGGLFLLAALVLFVTFWVIYVILYLSLEYSHAVRLFLSALVLALLFVANAITPRGALQEYSFTTGTTYGKPVTIVIPFVGVGSTINPLAPDSMRSFVKVLADIVLGGPRLMAVAVPMLAGSQRLDGMDVAGCAAVLAFLAERDGPVPFPEIAAAIPEGHDVVAVLTQVQKLEGVRLVTSEPAGLSLFSDLRAELPKGKRRRSGKAEGDPEAAFAVFPEKVPVLAVAPDDPEMKAAEAEARRRWPEFLAAFARRQPAQTFAVKVPIRDGDSVEFLWLTVLGVENDVISGKVDNEPVQLTNVKLGSRVRLKQQVLNDWLYTDGGKMVGGFTVKVLQARQGS